MSVTVPPGGIVLGDELAEVIEGSKTLLSQF
jgi:hypothetical protein